MDGSYNNKIAYERGLSKTKFTFWVYGYHRQQKG